MKKEKMCFVFIQPDVILYVNRLNTDESVIPFEYHHFDFCPIDEDKSPVENLGQVVFGERIRPGPYKIAFMKDDKCHKVMINNNNNKWTFYNHFTSNQTYIIYIFVAFDLRFAHDNISAAILSQINVWVHWKRAWAWTINIIGLWTTCR